MLNEHVMEHLQVLDDYLKAQRELIEVIQQNPTDEFEMNSHHVRMMELEIEMEKLSVKLNDTISNLTKIRM